MESKQARELNEAAERLEAAAESLAAVLGQFAEFERRRMAFWRESEAAAPEPAFRGLRDEEATSLALAAVRRIRGERVREADTASPPSEREISRWNDEVIARREEEGF